MVWKLVTVRPFSKVVVLFVYKVLSVAGYLGEEPVFDVVLKPNFTDRHRNPSKRFRSLAEANPHHAGEAYSNLLATIA